MVAETLVGRIAELQQLDANLRTAKESAFRLVVIGGEAGIGKSRLVREFVSRIRDVRQLTGVCLPLEEASLPYGPVVDALRGLLAGWDAGELASIAGPAWPELTKLVPQLDPRGEVSTLHVGQHPGGRQRFFDLLLGMLERLARTEPLVLVIEDIQWSDAATRDLLRFLVRGLRHAPILMIVTARTDGSVAQPGAAFMAELARLASAARIDLSRLSEREVRDLVAQLLGREPSPIYLRSINDRAEGNPFLIEHLVQASPEGEVVPAVVSETLGLGLRSLSPSAREVLRVAAACGRRIDEDLISTASGLDRQRVRNGLSESVAESLLMAVVEDGVRSYQFRHALVREMVDAELLPADRRRLHTAIATALEAAPDSPPGELAYHWEAAHEWQRAVLTHLEAARAAERVYAWVNAFRHYERVRALIERPGSKVHGDLDRAELLHRAAEAAYLAADYPAAIARGRQAIASVSGRDDARTGALHERLRAYLWDSGDRRGAMASVEEALRLIPADPPSRARARVLAQSAAVMMHTGRLAEAGEGATAALAVAQRTGSVSDIGQAMAILSWIKVLEGETEAGLRGLWRGVEAAEQAEDAMGIALGRALIAYLLDWVGRIGDAREVALAGHERLVALGLHRTYGGILLGYAAMAATHLGRWDEAIRLVESGLEHDQSGPAGHWLRINRGRLHALHGRWNEAESDLRAARDVELRSGGTEYGDQLIAVEAELAAWRESLPDARKAADAVQRRPPGMPAGPAVARAALFSAIAEADGAALAAHRGDLLAVGEAVQRTKHLTRLVAEGVPPVAYVREAPAWKAARDALDAEVLRASSEDDTGTWSSLVAGWEAAQHPVMVAYAEYRHASSIFRSGGDTAHAYELLARARARCDALGAEALGIRIDEVAHRVAGGTARPVSGALPDGHRVGPPELLSVYTLGRFRVERAGEPIHTLGGAKAGRRQAQAFFAFLFDRGARGVTKDEVIELIWSEADLDRADTAFHRTLGGLRRVIGPGSAPVAPPGAPMALFRPAVHFEHDRYVLDQRVIGFSDAAAFDAAVDAAHTSVDPMERRSALEEARRLYAGDYFDDCPYFGDSAEVEPSRSRLRERMVAVLVMLGQLDEEGGRLHAAAEWYREALQLSDGEDVMAADALTRLGGQRRPALRLLER